MVFVVLRMLAEGYLSLCILKKAKSLCASKSCEVNLLILSLNSCSLVSLSEIGDVAGDPLKEGPFETGGVIKNPFLEC